jgi:hypothetical protein
LESVTRLLSTGPTENTGWQVGQVRIANKRCCDIIVCLA